ncbi:uncharacterized protein B0I36DRAFT_383491 [Microdochium trichocladiopsis]|uniref:Uncharacterized protein n=1 Tax=Microdochium trichocladiopsis TaxID=1682393 RepID=A0A9P8Y7M3_9PEZI|nr:uncharacterized protein B0I36DRAFT_383491 [Microdochium trichocladiopsis]KAH7033675.1 hypothetical protein B0I36DRAFT_383491 [Microdochium trichocladiopsis]
MPSSIRLSDEIYVRILDKLTLSEVNSARLEAENRLRRVTLSRICLVSRNLRRLAEPLLYHHPWHPNGGLLTTLCSRPALGERVRHITFREQALAPPDPMMKSILLAFHGATVREIARAKYRWPELDALLDDVLKARVSQIYRRGETEALLLLMILVVTPNVETLVLSRLLFDSSQALSLLFTLCSNRITASENDSVEPFGPLRKLYSISTSGIADNDVPDTVRESKNARSFIFFPRLQSFSASCLDWAPSRRPARNGHDDNNSDNAREVTQINEESHTSEELPGPPMTGAHPNLRHLALLDSSFVSPTAVREILVVFPNLQSLLLHFFVHHDPSSHVTPQLDFAQLGNVLREPGARQLRRLELEHTAADTADGRFEELGRGFIGPLRNELTSLEQLRIPLASLAGVRPKALDLCEMLPPSLRWLWTSVTITGDSDAHVQAIFRMLNQAAAKLPLLEWVMVRFPRSHNAVLFFMSNDFAVATVGKRHALFRKKVVSPVRTPPGWEHELLETDVWMP